MTDRSDYLLTVELFADLPREARVAIADRCTWTTYDPGVMIFSQGDTPGDVYFLAQGTIRASIYSASGKHVIFQDMHAGSLFGEISAMDGEQRSASIEARSTCLIAALPGEAFTDLLRNEPELGVKLVRILSREIRRLSARVVEFSTLSVRHRIHAELLRLADRQPGRREGAITPAPKLSDIANRISTHREAVSRELSRLIRIGLLERTPDSMRITDLSRLQQMIENAELD